MPISAVPEDLCLAFANTRCWRGSPSPVERLLEPSDLVAWLETAGMDAGVLRQVLDRWRESPRVAAKTFAAAIELRESIYRVFAALATKQPAAHTDFALLREAVAKAPSRRDLMRAGDAFMWQVTPRSESATGLLTPVLWSAADLMVEAGRRRVRQCANDKCLWLFIDESKSGTRRWCDMSSCGNRAKAQRHYSRKRAA